VLHNCPDEEIFSPRDGQTRLEGTGFRVVHHGTLMRRYGLDVLLEAFARVAARLPNARLDVFGEGDLEAELQRRAERPDLAGRVQLHGDVSQDRLADELAGADLCVVPNRSDPFTDLLLPTKLLEALRMGRPAIASATPVIDQAFADDEVHKVPPDDPQALAEAIVALATDDRARAALAKKGSQAADRYLWSEEKKKLLSLYEELIGL
jgi:glycosyltransferase involved in cell wall biosynthesis